MDACYAQHYRELFERHWWWRARERLILERLRRIHCTRPLGTILDVGCGAGLFFDRLAEFGDVEGVESDASLLHASGDHRSRIHVGSFDASFRPGRRYSLILMLDVIEHLHDPVDSLRHELELFEPGGGLVATVPSFPVLWTTHDDLNHHVTRYTKRSFGELAVQAGLHIESAEYIFH